MEDKPASDDHSGHDHGDHDHGDHGHEVGPAGATYDLRFIDAMVQHPTGALPMSDTLCRPRRPGFGATAPGPRWRLRSWSRVMGCTCAWMRSCRPIPACWAPASWGSHDSQSLENRFSQLF